MDCINKQECIPVGCVPSATVAVCWGDGGCLLWGVSALGGVCSGGVSAWGGLLLGGGLLQGGGGGGIPACTEADHPWTDRQV